MATPKKFGRRPQIRGGRLEAVSLVRGSRLALKASLEHALLGMIAEQEPVSGYDLIKTFRISMVHFWHAHQGQIYPTLDRMERAGLVQSREIVQRGRPNKRLFSITPSGKQMLLEWLSSPYEGLKTKHPSVLRMRFLGHLGPVGARDKLIEERAAVSRHLDTYLELEREYFGAPPRYANVDMMFSYFTLRQGIRTMQTNIELCDWAIGEIERNRALFGKHSRGMIAPQTHARRRRAAS